MTILEKMKMYNLPVKEEETLESNGVFSFTGLTREQSDLVNRILSGFLVSLSTNTNVIIGNGLDEIDLMVVGEPNSTVIVSVMTGATPSTITVNLDETGIGTQPFSCQTTPTKIVFSVGDVSCQVRSL